MKKIENLFVRGAAYSALIMLLYYLFAIISSPDVSISFNRFLWILLFGYVIAVTKLLLDKLEPSALLRHLLQYAVYLATFLIVFLVGMSNPVNRVFAMIVVFTFLYVAISLIAHFAKKLLGYAEEKTVKTGKPQKSSVNAKKEETNEYTPKFK